VVSCSVVAVDPLMLVFEICVEPDGSAPVFVFVVAL
jgi:hypothetical protein